MKSAVFYGKHDVRIEERPQPVMQDKDVLIKVMACGMCGTDVHIFEGDKGAGDTPVETILGHEFAGIVEAVGKKVTGIKVGDRVCVDPNQLCGSCYYCKNGVGHFCENMIGYGTGFHGGFAEYCSVNESQVYPLAETTTYEEGAMAEPLACCLHGMDMCEVTTASTVVVIGGGMIGQLMIQLSKLSGANKIILLEPIESKRELAKQMGADLCINPLKEDVKAILQKHNIVRINTVIECAGLKSTIEQAIDLAGKKSVVMLFGLTKPEDTISVKPFELFQKEVVIKASFINPYTQSRAVQLINSKKVDVASLIYKTVPLSEFTTIISNREMRGKGKFVFVPTTGNAVFSEVPLL